MSETRDPGRISSKDYFEGPQFRDSPTYEPPVDPTKETAWDRIKREAEWGAGTGGALGLAVGGVTGGPPGAVVGGALGAAGGGFAGGATQFGREFLWKDAPWWVDPLVSTGIGTAEGGLPVIGRAVGSAARSLGSHVTGAGILGTALAAREFGGEIAGMAHHAMDLVGAGGTTLAETILGGIVPFGAGLARAARGGAENLLYPAIGLATGSQAALANTQNQPPQGALAPPRGGFALPVEGIGAPGL